MPSKLIKSFLALAKRDGQRLALIEKAIAEYQAKCCGMPTTY